VTASDALGTRGLPPAEVAATRANAASVYLAAIDAEISAASLQARLAKAFAGT